MKDLIQTPYGVVRLGTLQALQSSFDTTMLLKTVEDLDEFWVHGSKNCATISSKCTPWRTR